MKKLILLFLVFGIFKAGFAYDKTSLVERFTNCSCGPCATVNNSWYNATTPNLINNHSITYVVYNVDWPF